MASASVPSLPSRTVAQLLAGAQQAAARPPGPMTATLQESTSLGLPALPASGPLAGVAGSIASLSGSHSIEIWYLNPSHVRIAEPVSMGESDLRLDGSQLWLWSSKTQTATHVLLPRDAGSAALHGQHPASPGASTPVPSVRQLLAAVGPTTSVRVGQNATVAGQAAYQLVIAPKTSGSLVSQIVVALDARNYLPLRVQVFARGVPDPVLQGGYTSLSFGQPAMSNFTFSPPPGAIVKTVRVPDQVPSGLLGSLTGLGSSTGLAPGGLAGSSAPVIALKNSGNVPDGTLKQIVRSFAASLPASMPPAQRASMISAFTRQAIEGVSVNPSNGGGFFSIPTPASAIGRPTVVGKGWLSVLLTPPSPELAALLRQPLASPPAGSGVGGEARQAPAETFQPSSPVGTTEVISAAPEPAGVDLVLLEALLRASAKVSGSWGSGRLLRTSLFSVLITSNGRVLVGAVTPAVLYADAATAG